MPFSMMIFNPTKVIGVRILNQNFYYKIKDTTHTILYKLLKKVYNCLTLIMTMY
jgi:hypothetical protein